MLRRDHGAIGDAEQEIAYVVRDGQTERTIAYMPRGRGSFTSQMLTMDPHSAGDRLTRCEATLAGH